MKYLKSKKDSVEESILQVWKTAAELAEVGLDGRTKEYRNHRSRLETARGKRESASKVKKEESILQNEATIDLLDHDKSDRDFQKLIKKLKLKATDIKGDDGTTVTGDEKAIEKMLQTMYGNDWKDMYKLKANKYLELSAPVWENSAKQNEASGDKEAYQKFFNKALKKFGINSPAELKSDEEKKKFYDYIDKNWTADHEESVKKEARQLKDPKKEMMVSLKGKVKVINKSEWPEYKKKGYIQAEEVEENFDVGTPENTKSKLKVTPGQSAEEWEEQVETIQKKNSSMRERLAQIWSMDEGDNPFAPQKKKEEKTPKKTMTGEPVTKVKVDPKIDDR